MNIFVNRRGRRVVADPKAWEPTMKSPYIGMCVWPVPENKVIVAVVFNMKGTGLFLPVDKDREK